MTLEDAKYQISINVSTIKKLLQIRSIAVVPNQEGNNYIIFNDFSTLETFENEVLDSYYIELESLINICYLNELDANKRALLVESIIEVLTFEEHYYDSNLGIEQPFSLREKQLIHQFEELQVKLQIQIINQLTSAYLSNKKVNMAKIAKLTWKGEQKELAELFDQLKRKGWITVKGSNASYYRALAALFEVPGSISLEANLKDYHRNDAPSPITTQGLFSVIQPNPSNN
ncbi:hypothetical protein [Mucilaginibacter sp. KACC 22063]|uniref:hypothetical protein n=1 Tax=Mucilaginibacter sp. KACC 22063 TaxID=3025666 RepID=UPI002366B598|nr:hypothetical protein [Mucilaginibacter sp. KACC 22063]WDF55262.1 hypothetical protein PQ461_20220 [Mucilaginibacter sp. KACC 22063]